jgi:hypothetical protein
MCTSACVRVCVRVCVWIIYILHTNIYIYTRTHTYYMYVLKHTLGLHLITHSCFALCAWTSMRSSHIHVHSSHIVYIFSSFIDIHIATAFKSTLSYF